jgi:hypothetical protein
MCEHLYQAAQSAQANVPAMPFETAITIVLAALAALLTALAIIIGIVAIWGWAGIKEEAAKAAREAIDRKTKDYPAPERMLELVFRMEEILGSWDNIQDKLVSGNAAKGVAPASNAEVQQQAPVAPPYPGEGAQNVSTTTANPEPHNPDPNIAEPGANSG